MVADNNRAGYYGYDGNGERVYKLTGTSSIGQINSGSTQAQVIFDDAVLYPNPYVTIARNGYTKHYYAGTERLATVIGGGGFDDMIPAVDNNTKRHEQDVAKAFDAQYQQKNPFYFQDKVTGNTVATEDIKHQQHKELEYQCKPTYLDYVDVQLMQDILLKPISVYEQIYSQTEDVYFSHGDHLGSANWITDGKGKPIQYIHYAPYGELIDNQQAAGYDERYKFTGKERDWETGYDMFGARYLWSDAGTWLSVDPLADKYPNISPYAYAAWNPIKYVDPDGRTYVINTNGKTEKIDDGKNNHVVLNANNSRERVEIYLTKGNILELCPSKSAEGNVNLLRMENLDVANELYEAMGMNMTMLEFNVVSAHSGDEYLYYVGNTQDSRRTGIGNYVFDILGQTIDYMKHFHPTNPKVSDADKLRAESVYRNTKDYPQANPNAKLYITYRNEEGELKDVEY